MLYGLTQEKDDEAEEEMMLKVRKETNHKASRSDRPLAA